MEIIKQRIVLSNREIVEVLEIKERFRLKYFSYTYKLTDKSGNERTVIRWDNYGGQAHYDTYDSNQQLLQQQDCDYKNPSEIIRLIKIFKHNLVTMDLTRL